MDSHDVHRSYPGGKVLRPKLDPDSFVSYPPPTLGTIYVHNITGHRVRIVGKVGLSRMLGRWLTGNQTGRSQVLSGYDIHRNYTLEPETTED